MFGVGKHGFTASKNPNMRRDGTMPPQLPTSCDHTSLSFHNKPIYPCSPGMTQGTAYTMDGQDTLSLRLIYGPTPTLG